MQIKTLLTTDKLRPSWNLLFGRTSRVRIGQQLHGVLLPSNTSLGSFLTTDSLGPVWACESVNPGQGFASFGNYLVPYYARSPLLGGQSAEIPVLR